MGSLTFRLYSYVRNHWITYSSSLMFITWATMDDFMIKYLHFRLICLLRDMVLRLGANGKGVQVLHYDIGPSISFLTGFFQACMINFHLEAKG